MDVRIRLLLRIIEESEGSFRMTPKIGSLLGLGEARVHLLFNREMGKTLRRHVLEVRMARAARLLSNVASPIKAVAFECGYTEVSNFCRDFKRVHRMSPLQMRLRQIDAQLSESAIACDMAGPGLHNRLWTGTLPARHPQF
jgi:AraC-like DNA-binding protein